jgi:preprotein translocase subunit SecF
MGLSRRERREARKKLLKEQRLQQLKSIEEQEKKAERKSEYKGFLRFYDKHYLKLEIIPLILLILAIAAIGYQVATTGDFMNKGVSLEGGMVITIPINESVSISEVEKILKSNFPKDDLEIRDVAEFGVQKAVIITTDNLNTEKEILDAIAPLIPNAKEHASTEITGSSLGGGFFKQTMIAVLIAFVCMSIVVFVSFKNFAPSMMVIICVFADIIETLAVTNLLGIRLSTAGIAAFLMLIGYSVDTDILLTSRVLRSKEGTVFQRTLSAAKTGLLMTFTTITAVTISLLLTTSSTIKEIMTIMLIGLIFDIINTWIQNVALLRYHLEHIKGRKAAQPMPSEAIVEEEINDNEVFEEEALEEEKAEEAEKKDQ